MKYHNIIWNIFVLSLYLVLTNTSYYYYKAGIQYRSIEEITDNKENVIVSLTTCYLCLVVSTNILFFCFVSSKIIKAVFFIPLIYTFLMIWFVDQKKAETENFGYGYYTSRGITLLFLLIEIFLLPLFLCFKYFSFRTVGRITKYGFFIILFFCGLFLLYVIYRIAFRDQIFRKGLFGLVLQNSESYCSVDTNTILVSAFLPKFFFHIFFMTYDCSKEPIFVKRIDPYSDKTSKLSTIEITCPLKSSIMINLFPNFHNFTFSELKGFDNHRNPIWSYYGTSIRKKMKRITLDINNKESPVRFSYDSNFYETILVQCDNNKNFIVFPSRRRIEKEYTNVRNEIATRKLETVSKKRPNIVILFLDSVSRKDFERRFSKTIGTIRSLRNIDFYQFLNFKSIGRDTHENSRVLFTGEKLSHNIPLYETAKEEGYVTASSMNFCGEWGSLYNHYDYSMKFDSEKSRNLRNFRTDYYLAEPFCDESYDGEFGVFRIWRGASAMGRRCLMQKESSEFIFDYAKDMENLFPDNPKFSILGFEDGHEATGESLNYLDLQLSKYLEFVKNTKNGFHNTLVAIVSDHGNSFNFVQNNFKEGKVGVLNPAFYIISPKNFIMGDRRVVEINQHRLISGYDFHKTINDVLRFGGNRGVSKNKEFWKKKINRFGNNLLMEEIDKKRSCADIGVSNGGSICDVRCT